MSSDTYQSAYVKQVRKDGHTNGERAKKFKKAAHDALDKELEEFTKQKGWDVTDVENAKLYKQLKKRFKLLGEIEKGKNVINHVNIDSLKEMGLVAYYIKGEDGDLLNHITIFVEDNGMDWFEIHEPDGEVWFSLNPKDKKLDSVDFKLEYDNPSYTEVIDKTLEFLHSIGSNVKKEDISK